ncbi:hypothetical protein [Aquimarina sp. AU58]|uniref:hypothetical protein n=1 Tax=Aquimarina sp. AU58 TaxID=1874112 RepID=UPI00135C6C8F|nr:hypothetical protein [Aquimarina sp. AU58]
MFPYKLLVYYYGFDNLFTKEHDHYDLQQLVFPKDTSVVEDRPYFDFDIIAQRIGAENILAIHN